MVLRQKLFLAFVVVANVLLWAIPSNVAELVARDRHVLLGRYSRGHFAAIVAALIASAIGLYIDQARTRQAYKRRRFQFIASLIVLLPVILIIDYAARSPETGHYIKDGLAYHHPPNGTYEAAYEDRSQAHRTYPNAPPGYGRIDRTLHTDARGFRNTTALDASDVVVLGDSFAEGSGVSDEHPWPVKLAGISGLTVYNLGMSGYSPAHYLAALQDYGLALKPRYVLCMIYEGNDFRSAAKSLEEQGDGLGQRIVTYFKQSPIRSAVDQFFIGTFGPMGAHRRVASLDILSWLPLRVPDMPQGKYYTFAPKQLLQTYRSQMEFEHGPRWAGVAAMLGQLHDACRRAGTELVFVYAPTKAHVVMPLVLDHLPAEKVHAFAALRSDDLPEPEVFLGELGEYFDSKESVMREWSERRSIAFVSTTEALRSAAANGLQVYFTYDQHWTPVGHQVVAETVNAFLTDQRPSENQPNAKGT